MKRPRILLILLALLLAVGAAAAILLGRSVHSLRQTQMQAHAVYAALYQNASDYRLNVTEGGQKTGSYTLERLGLLQPVLEDLDARTSDFARMEPDEFAALSLPELLHWARADRSVPAYLPLDGQAMDIAPIVQDLAAIPRIAPQNSRAVFSGGAYRTHPARPGTELDLPRLDRALREEVQTLCLQPGGPEGASVDIAALGCYLQPELTGQNARFDYPALLQRDAEGLEISVQLLDRTVQLAVSPLVQADSQGAVLADEAALRAQVHAWAEETNRTGSAYLLASCTGETVPVRFLSCNYTLDEQALCAALQQKLRLLDCTPVTATYACTDTSGAPFSPLGDTYVEVSIRAQRMAFYQNGEQLALTDIVTGKPDGHQTPTGLYHVQNKAPDCWLTGPDYHVFVKYWVGFYGAYGIHDASWRTLFGSDYYLYGGSHGCVNTPDAAMQTIYEAIEPGVPVLVH